MMRQSVEVRTGGKPYISRKDVSLFTVSATSGALTPNSTPPYTWDFNNPVSPQSLSIHDQSADASGKVYLAIPSSTVVDVTLSAPPDWFKWTMSAEDVTPFVSFAVPSGLTELEYKQTKDVENDPAHPGKVLFVNNGDADNDGVPNYADGFDKFGNQGANAGGVFTDFSVRIKYPIDPTRALVKFVYPESDPATMERITDADGIYQYQVTGALRVWKKDGNSSRTIASDYIKSGQTYLASDLGFGAAEEPIASKFTKGFFVEAIAASKNPGDARIEILIDPDGAEGPAGFIGADAVRMTVLETTLVEIDPVTNVATPTQKVKISNPSPFVSGNVSVTDLAASSDKLRILGSVNLQGTVNHALADLSLDGNLTDVKIYVNSYDVSLGTLPLSGTKSTNPGSYTRPFPFVGAFSGQFTNVEFYPGVNLVRVTATDSRGFTGYSDFWVEITATPQIITVGFAAAAFAEAEAGENCTPSEDTYCGYTFTAASAVQGPQSTGGETKYYGTELKGGGETFLNTLSRVYVTENGGVAEERKLLSHTAGKRLFGSIINNHLFPTVRVHLRGGTSLAVPMPDTNYQLGVWAGFWQGGVSTVEGAWETLRLVAPLGSPVSLVIYTGTGGNFSEQKKSCINTYQTIAPLVSFCVQWRSRQFEDIYTSSDPAGAALAAMEDDWRLVAGLTRELIIALEAADQQATQFERGKLAGRVVFEAVTMVVGELKVAHFSKAGKLTKGRFLDDLLAHVETRPLTESQKQRTRTAIATARARALERSRVGPYGTLQARAGHAKNHLNQDRVFQSVIPSNEGIAVEMLGEYTQVGTPHWRFHHGPKGLNKNLWNKYRRGGPRFPDRPTCAEYHEALREALREADLPEEEITELLNEARIQRLIYGLTDDMKVPEIPKR